jgi:rhodanese-related sulfurtransferase
VLHTIPLLAATCLTGFAMQSFVWFWLKQWIRVRYSSVPSIRPDRLQKILAKQQADDWLVLDARTTAEFNVSCLPGAVLIGDGEEMLRSGPLGNAARERPILVCCAVGVRSAVVVKRLRERGFRKAVNLEGGLFEWVNQGHQLVHEGLPTTLVHPFNRFWGLLLKPHR